jgi:hypothetical protein
MSQPSNPAPSPIPPQRSRRGLWIGLSVALLLLVLLVGVGALFVAPQLCTVTEPQRQGLACDIPLPPNTTFDREVSLPGGELPGVPSQSLQYHVANTTPDQISSFYTQRLPANGWKCVRGDIPSVISGQQERRSVIVSLHPVSGSTSDVTIIISVLTFNKELGDDCNP